MSVTEPATAFREFAPPEPLRRFVAAIWTFDGAPGLAPHRVLPDGCVDFLFDLGGRDERRGLVVGTMTRAILGGSDPSARLVGVRFRPGMASAFLGAPVERLTDGRAPLGEFLRDARGLARRVAAAEDVVGAIELSLTSRLGGVRALEPFVEVAIDEIVRRHGAVPIDALAAELDVSRQHLTRTFRARVGVGPKAFARVLRLQRLVDLLPREGRRDWAALALDAGYCDQPHLVAECRALAGVTPTLL